MSRVIYPTGTHGPSDQNFGVFPLEYVDPWWCWSLQRVNTLSKSAMKLFSFSKYFNLFDYMLLSMIYLNVTDGQTDDMP